MPIELTRGAGNAIEGWAWEAGDYRITTELAGSKAGIAGSFAKTVSVPVKEVPAPIELKGAWEVSFDPKWGGPEKAVFEKLMDWTEHSDPGIKHYSGKAVYRQSFEHAGVARGKTLWCWTWATCATWRACG